MSTCTLLLLRRELGQYLSVVAYDLCPRDGDPQTITGALGREGPLSSVVCETSWSTCPPETEPSTCTEASTGCNTNGVCWLRGRYASEFQVDISREQKSGNVLWEEVVCTRFGNGIDEVLFTPDCSRRDTERFISLKYWNKILCYYICDKKWWISWWLYGLM